jgi:hypothetical protein
MAPFVRALGARLNCTTLIQRHCAFNPFFVKVVFARIQLCYLCQISRQVVREYTVAASIDSHCCGGLADTTV